MRRRRSLLARSDLQVTLGALFLLVLSWPLWASARPSHTLLFMFAAWIGVIAVLALIAVRGEPGGPAGETADLDEDDDGDD